MSAPVLTFTIPIKTVNESNGQQFGRAQWGKLARRRQAKHAVELVTNTLPRPGRFPMVVRLTRLSAGVLDDDGLRSSLKSCRDAMAAWLGADDGDVERLRFAYEQEPCKRGQHSVRVEVFELMRLVERMEVAV